MSSNRNYYRAQARAAIAPRNQSGQFSTPYTPPDEQPDSTYWKESAARARNRLPDDLPWAALTELLWPEDYTPTWRETANCMTLAAQYWVAGKTDLPELAEKLSPFTSNIPQSHINDSF